MQNFGPGWGVRLDGSGTDDHHQLRNLTTYRDHPQYVDRMGFLDPTEANITFVNATRTLIIAPTGATFRLFMYGVQYDKTTESVAITDTEGLWYVYYDANQVLTATQVEWDLELHAPVALIYWDAANNQQIYFGWELHGLTMPAHTHRELHYAFHAQYDKDGGLAVTDITYGTGALDVDAQCGVSDGQIYDEDIRIAIRNAAVPATRWEQILAAPAQIPGFYKWGAAGDWRLKAADDYPCMQAAFTTVGTRLNYNDPAGPWDFAEAANRAHVAVFIAATNNSFNPVIFICGQREDKTIANALVNNTWDGLDLTGLPFQEVVPIARLIFRTANGYANAILSRIVDYQDLRGTPITGASYVPVNHSSLSGLNLDDHPQYLLGGEDILDLEISGNVDDYNPTNLQTAQIIRLVTDGTDYNITGITAPDGTYRINGKLLVISNADAAQNITLTDEDAASVAANRFSLGGSNLILGPGEAVTLWYDTASGRWRLLGTSVGRGNCCIETGNYTGDGGVAQAINLTDANLVIKALWIWPHPTAEAWEWGYFKMDQTWADYCLVINKDAANNVLDNRINSIGTGTFTVDDDGADSDPNKNGATYDYLVIGTH